MPDLEALFWPFLISFGTLVAAGVGAPIPEEVPVIGAGIWVASNPDLGPLRWLIFPVCFIGILISDVLLYCIGRFGGRRLLEHRWLARLMPPGRREKIESNFHRYGVRVLLMVRWFPGIRSPMFITAGTMRLPLHRFVIADAIAAVVGHSLLFFLAYWFGDSFKSLFMRAEDQVQSILKPVLILAVIAAVAAYILFHFYKRPVSTGDPKEVPLGQKVAATIESTGSKADLKVQVHPHADCDTSDNGALAEGVHPPSRQQS